MTPADGLLFLFERVLASLDSAFRDDIGSLRVVPPYDVTADSVAASLETVAGALLRSAADAADRAQLSARARQAGSAGVAEARTVLTGLDVLRGPTESGVRLVEQRLMAALV